MTTHVASHRERSASAQAAHRALVDSDAAMRSLFAKLLRFESVSGHEGAMTEYLAEWGRQQGFQTDLWQSQDAELAAHPLAAARHLPLAGRPTLVMWLGSSPQKGATSLLFNAHSDVVAAPGPHRWTAPPFGGIELGGWFYGRGACDVKGPLVSALWAMLALRETPPAGAVGIEIIPGEEDCVGLGTLGSVVRGHRADGCLVLEPTENIPRCASRGGCRFEIIVSGRAVHGTVKWLGVDAIGPIAPILHTLQQIEQRLNDRGADALFAAYPIARPITVDMIRAGEWQGMVCDRAMIAGYFELLPKDDLAEFQQRFVEQLRAALAAVGVDTSQISVEFPETYAGHRTAPDSALCGVAARVAGVGLEWSAFNAGCEAGVRAAMQGTPTLVWGPGSLQHAHAVDERIAWHDIRHGAEMFTELALDYCVRRV